MRVMVVFDQKTATKMLSGTTDVCLMSSLAGQLYIFFTPEKKTSMLNKMLEASIIVVSSGQRDGTAYLVVSNVDFQKVELALADEAD